ncbi:hypothetical protein [Acrocarpospora catenulata]|nr:hypothetical protein [Acrocarpospora catenulata]
MPLPLTLFTCPVTGDVILVPVGTVHMRLTPEQQRELVDALVNRGAAA